MTYRVVLAEEPSPGKQVGDNVFLDDVPPNCRVYLFYYPGAMPDAALEKALRELGEIAGNNLFVNIGRLDDPQYDKIASHFSIKSLPVIVLTADASLASPSDSYLSSFVRIDNKSLLSSPERCVNFVQQIVNLFLQGKIAEAVSQGSRKGKLELLRSVGTFLADAMKSLGGFIADRDFSFSVAEGKSGLLL